MYNQNILYICSVVSLLNHATNIEKNMTNQLHTKKGTGKEISRRLRVSEQTVSKAIRGKIDTATARRIRAIAIRDYGAKELKD